MIPVNGPSAKPLIPELSVQATQYPLIVRTEMKTKVMTFSPKLCLLSVLPSLVNDIRSLPEVTLDASLSFTLSIQNQLYPDNSAS